MSKDPVLLPAPRTCSWKLDERCYASKVVVESDRAIRRQGYRISLRDGGVRIASADAAGEFYARQTLAQLRRQFGEGVPQGEIGDWPDFPVRGVMLDISRDKVPTMETLFPLIDLLAELKINQLQ